jgi:hypothetical protein
MDLLPRAVSLIRFDPERSDDRPISEFLWGVSFARLWRD